MVNKWDKDQSSLLYLLESIVEIVNPQSLKQIEFRDVYTSQQKEEIRKKIYDFNKSIYIEFS